MEGLSPHPVFGRCSFTATILRALLILVSICFGAAEVAAGSLDRDLAAALRGLPHAKTVAGACVLDLDSGKTVFSHQPDTLLVPASTMKVFTMATSLALLGPTFEFETVLAFDGSNLIVIGDGDPGFSDAKLMRARGMKVGTVFDDWISALTARGMQSIAGDLVIDESVFDDQLVHPSWEQADLGKWYAAPVAGLNINDNCLDITIQPQSNGSVIGVEITPANSLVTIVNKCRFGKKRTPILHHRPDTFEYVISGRCSKRWKFSPVAFPDPGLLFASSIRTALKDAGIPVSGGVRRGRVRDSAGRLPTNVDVVATHRTPMPDVLRRVGKNSQNFFSECLLKRCGLDWARRHRQPNAVGSWSSGRGAVLEVMRSTGIDVGGLVVDDGSGLSRKNQCSARQLASTLAWCDRQSWSQLFRDSLSVAGVDGSLRKRMKELSPRIIGKTGTMRGICALAGFVESTGGRRFAFAVLFNGYQGGSSPYRRIQDRVCNILAADQSDGTR